jgi:hypothetical protein
MKKRGKQEINVRKSNHKKDFLTNTAMIEDDRTRHWELMAR